MKLIKLILMIIIFSMFIDCSSANTNYDQFALEFIDKLITYNGKALENVFNDNVIIRGFGETSYSLNRTNDFNGYSQKRGELYSALFLTKEMKNIFGYDNNPCFAEAFIKQQKEIVKRKRGDIYFIWIVLDNNRYDFFIKETTKGFKIVMIQLNIKMASGL